MNNLKDAGRYLSMRIRKREEQKTAEAQQMQQLQAQAKQQELALSAQAKQQELQMEYAIKLQFEQAMHQMKMEQIMAQNQGKERAEVVRGEYDIVEAQVQAGAKIDSQNSMEDRKDERMREEKSIQSELIQQQKSENPVPKDFKDSGTKLSDLLPS